MKENMNNNEVLAIIDEMSGTTAGVAGKIVGTILTEAVDIPIRFTAGVVKSGAVSQTGRLAASAFGLIKKGVTSDLSKRALSGGKSGLIGIADKVISKSPLLVELESAVKSDVTRIKEASSPLLLSSR
jgi:hypothetical protein